MKIVDRGGDEDGGGGELSSLLLQWSSHLRTELYSSSSICDKGSTAQPSNFWRNRQYFLRRGVLSNFHYLCIQLVTQSLC
ncbi:hypothetical protein RDI58_017833 [Solanum bulbocastanum]|uniref:Uncharacterized protein n=1 Tax=Solanum bulbocastanum TaxID=147425 RepID=A0AAN8YCD9_SOLBU